MSIDYTHLDALLLEAIERKPKTFTALRAEFEKEFDKHVPPDRMGAPNGRRAIDRRLQTLRKAGHIKADPKLGWVAIRAQTGGEHE